MNPELVSEKRLRELYETAGPSQLGPMTDFLNGAQAALEDLEVERVVAFKRDKYSSECPFNCEACYCNLKDTEGEPRYEGLSSNACPGLIGKSCDEVSPKGTVLVRAK